MDIFGCTNPDNSKELKRIQNIEIVELYVEEIWNKWNFSIIDSIIGEEFVDPASTTGEKGPEAFKAVMASFQSIFPKINLTIDEIVADEKRVAWKWTATATYTPTKKEVILNGIIMDRIEDGKIVERCGFWDDSILKE